tara:strand:- start:57 stop:257 length:201 start_codon:yes stop_codon:yes gene_type:complete
MEFLNELGLSTIIWSLLGLFEIIVRLTPSTKDNSIFNKIVWVVEKIIPNKSNNKEINHKLVKEKNN